MEDRFREGQTLLVGPPEDAREYEIRDVRFQQGRPIVGLNGVETMNDAEALAGHELRVPVDRLAALPDGVFYRHDLIGCRVATTRGEAIGIVSDVEGTMSGSRLVVEGPDGEVLIPLAAEICTTIDPASKRIVIDPPDGLIDANARRG